LQGHLICYSDFTADLRFRMRKVCRDIADMNLLESGNELVTYSMIVTCLVCLSPLIFKLQRVTKKGN